MCKLGNQSRSHRNICIDEYGDRRTLLIVVRCILQLPDRASFLLRNEKYRAKRRKTVICYIIKIKHLKEIQCAMGIECYTA